MRELSFDEGYLEYRIAADDSRIIRIRPDPNIITRISTAISGISEIQERIGSGSTEETVSAADTEIRSLLNSAFGADICTPAFGTANPLTPVNGRTLLESFIEAFIPMLEEDIRNAFPEAAAEPEAVKKYLK